MIRGTRRLRLLSSLEKANTMSKITQLKFVQTVLVEATNTQRVTFTETTDAADLLQRLVENGFMPDHAGTFAFCSNLVANKVFSQDFVEAAKEECRAARQGRLDLLKSKSGESANAMIAYTVFKQMFANNTETIPKFGKDAAFINDGNQRANLMYDAEVIRQISFVEQAKNLGTEYEIDATKTIPMVEKVFLSYTDWFMGQAGSNAISEARANLRIQDRIKSGTLALNAGITFEKMLRLIPEGANRQRAPYAAYVNWVTGGELLKRMLLKSTDDNYIQEGYIFASGLKEKTTLDDRIQVVVAKFDSGRRRAFAENNKKEWDLAAKGEVSKAVPASLIAIHNGTAPEWTKDDVMKWLDSITKKGLEQRTTTSPEVDTAATKAVKAMQDSAVSLGKTSGGKTVGEMVKLAVGNVEERKQFIDTMETLAPVLDVVGDLFKADKENTTALIDQLRGIDVAMLPAIVAAVTKVLKPAPQGKNQPTKKTGK